MSTNYHAASTRLTLTRLHPHMDWILVIIEDRNDAAFAIWRAATFGYAIWLVGALIFALVLIVGHGRCSLSVDRRPGLSFWPRQRLESFTPPLLARHVDMERQIRAAATDRDRHMWYLLCACPLGLAGAEGASRIFFALAAATLAVAGRCYFRGLTTTDAIVSRRTDRWVVLVSAAFLLGAMITFVAAIGYNRQSLLAGTVPVRILAFAIGILLLGRCALAAGAHTGDARPEPAPATAGRWHRFWHGLKTWPSPGPVPARTGPRLLSRPLAWLRFGPSLDLGWIFAALVMGCAPAAAGFLDSYDQDRYLVLDRQEQLQARNAELRSADVRAIDLARLLKLPDGLAQDIETRNSAGQSAIQRPDTETCVTISCLALRYLNLREQALEYSDFLPFSLYDAFSGGHALTPLLPLLAPLLVLLLILIFFRREYFRQPPLLSPGKDPNFDPPLSLARDEFIHRALIPASHNRPPRLPFKPAGGNRHLILGVGLDIAEDWIDTAKTRRLGTIEKIQWIDLMEPPDSVQIEAPAVVIGNLDLALQDGNEANIRRTFEIIRDIAGAPPAHKSGGPHIFLLADIDPLDRIALLWQRQGSHDAAGTSEGWRWAALIQDFTLYPIRRNGPVPDRDRKNRVLRTIREELCVLDTCFAHELCDQLHTKMKKLSGRRRSDDQAEADRIVSFITEQMSDHYYKLWASSSDEERVMLYRVACDCHLKMKDTRGLRSLLTRGLLIRVPEYRLMNRSFTRYVLRIGATSNISHRAQSLGGLDKIWPLIRYPLAATAGASVLLLQFFAPSASGAVGALPALVALVPAVLGKWLQGRPGAA